MKNDLILQITQEIFDEISKLPPSNLQVAVNKHYGLWYKDGGLASILDEAGLGVYKYLAAILQKAGYKNANEKNVGLCIRRYEARHGLKSPKTEPVPAAGVITRKLDTSPVDRSVVVPGGSPSGGNLTSVEVSPVRVIEEKFPVATSSNSSSSVSGWWDRVAQKLGIEIKEISPDSKFNFKNIAIQVGIQNNKREDEDYLDYTKEELELIGGILYLCREKNIKEENKAVQVSRLLYLDKSEDAIKEMLIKCHFMGDIRKYVY